MALQSGKFGLQLGAKNRDQSFPGILHLQPWQLRSPASHIWTQTGLPALQRVGRDKGFREAMS